MNKNIFGNDGCWKSVWRNMVNYRSSDKNAKDWTLKYQTSIHGFYRDFNCNFLDSWFI